jgi:hypothetical protein
MNIDGGCRGAPDFAGEDIVILAPCGSTPTTTMR